MYVKKKGGLGGFGKGVGDLNIIWQHCFSMATCNTHKVNLHLFHHVFVPTKKFMAGSTSKKGKKVSGGGGGGEKKKT